MKGVSWILVLLLSGCHPSAPAKPDGVGHPLALPGEKQLALDAPKSTEPNHVQVIYRHKVGDYYRTALLVLNGKDVRSFQGGAEIGYYIKDAEPTSSEGGSFILLSQVAVGDADDGSKKIRHEVPYCSIVDTATGCMIARETGGFCMGEFDGHFWVSDVYGRLDLSRFPNRAKAVNADPEDLRYSAENLRFCESAGSPFRHRGQ